MFLEISRPEQRSLLLWLWVLCVLHTTCKTGLVWFWVSTFHLTGQDIREHVYTVNNLALIFFLESWSWGHPHCMYMSSLLASLGMDKPAATEQKLGVLLWKFSSALQSAWWSLHQTWLPQPSSIVPPDTAYSHVPYATIQGIPHLHLAWTYKKPLWWAATQPS